MIVQKFHFHLFGAIRAKNRDKTKWVYGDYGIAFDRKVERNSARNVLIFGIDNSSSSHTDNRKNNFFGKL